MPNNPIKLEVVTSPGCVHCHEFLEYWKTVSKDWPNVNLEERNVTTPEGQELVSKFMIFSSPGIIINDQLFAMGGVDKGKFMAKLKEL